MEVMCSAECDSRNEATEQEREGGWEKVFVSCEVWKVTKKKKKEREEKEVNKAMIND